MRRDCPAAGACCAWIVRPRDRSRADQTPGQSKAEWSSSFGARNAGLSLLSLRLLLRMHRDCDGNVPALPSLNPLLETL